MISPHGMLDGWALRQQRLKKRAARLLYEDAHLGQAACLHALCESEQNSIRELGYPAPVCVIPNGVDPMPRPEKSPTWQKPLDPGHKTLLFLGRVTRKKHVLELLQAWNSVAEQAAALSWRLVLVGPVDLSYGAALTDFLAAHPGLQSVSLTGPAYGPERAAAYHAADAFILPSVSEGLPMGALEALSCGLPSLLTPECNLPEAFDAGAALTISADPAGIAKGLVTLFNMTGPQHEIMSRNGKRLVAEHFTWERSAGLMETAYRQITALLNQAGAA
jgi:poly(glycerol-phosphate) alpha-glucosyltransferase